MYGKETAVHDTVIQKLFADVAKNYAEGDKSEETNVIKTSFGVSEADLAVSEMDIKIHVTCGENTWFVNAPDKSIESVLLT